MLVDNLVDNLVDKLRHEDWRNVQIGRNPQMCLRHFCITHKSGYNQSGNFKRPLFFGTFWGVGPGEEVNHHLKFIRRCLPTWTFLHFLCLSLSTNFSTKYSTNIRTPNLLEFLPSLMPELCTKISTKISTK